MKFMRWTISTSNFLSLEFHSKRFFPFARNFQISRRAGRNYSLARDTGNKFLRDLSAPRRVTRSFGQNMREPVCMRARISSFLHRRSLAGRLSLPRATDFR